MKLGRIIDWAIIVTGVLLAGYCLKGQEPAKTICGLNQADPTPNITLIQVACVDYDEIRRVIGGSPIAWPKGKVTQVLVHVREGFGVDIELDGAWGYSRLVRHQEGMLHAMVQFDGMEHTSMPIIRVFPEVR